MFRRRAIQLGAGIYMALAIIGIALLFFLGHALRWLFTLTRIPDVLILVALGVVVGPILGLVEPADFGRTGEVLTTIALIVILYEGGLQLNARELLRSSLPSLFLTILTFGSIATGAIFLALGLGLQSTPTAILFGLAVGSTSSTIVIPLVKRLSVSERMKSILSLESAFTDVLVVVLSLAAMDWIASGALPASAAWQKLGTETLMAAALGVGSALLWALVKRRFPQSIPKAFAGEAWALLTFGVIESLKLNGAVGALALGFSLANMGAIPDFARDLFHDRPVRLRELTLLSELNHLLRTFFFIYMGLFLRWESFSATLVAVAVTALIFITRYAAVRTVFRGAKGYQRLDAMVASAMGPRGLACAVIATVPFQRGFEGGLWIQNAAFLVIPLSILTSTVLVALSERSAIRRNAVPLFGTYPDPDPVPYSGDTTTEVTVSPVDFTDEIRLE